MIITEQPPSAIPTDLTLADFINVHGQPQHRHTGDAGQTFGWWTAGQYVELTRIRGEHYVAAWSRRAPPMLEGE